MGTLFRTLTCVSSSRGLGVAIPAGCRIQIGIMGGPGSKRLIGLPSTPSWGTLHLLSPGVSTSCYAHCPDLPALVRWRLSTT